MRKHFSSFARTLFIASIPIASVWCFTTLGIYAGNTTEFATSFIDILTVILPIAIGTVIGLALFSMLLTSRGRGRYESILCALAVLVWLQGNILVWKYGVFDGSAIDWTDGAWRGALDLGIWVILLLVAISATARTRRLLLAAASFTLLAQLFSAFFLLLSNDEILRQKEIASNFEGREALTRFSTKQNIVHIVMDGFQSDIFSEILAEESGHEYLSVMSGFTHFTQNVGAYPYTQLTIPALLSGKLFRNEQPVDVFVDNTLRGPTITNSAIESGFEVDIAAPIGLTAVYSKGKHTNAYGISPDTHVEIADVIRSDAARVADIALFRSVPHFAKALVHRDALWLFKGAALPRAYFHMRFFADVAFLRNLTNEMRADRDVPVYKIIHVMLSHRPFVANERCEYGGRKTESRAFVRQHAHCGLREVIALLQRMKDLDIYDSSLIVLMADHGAWVPVDDVADNGNVAALTIAMATPVLAVKPPQSVEAFQVSSAPTAITDVPATIAGLAEFPTEFAGESVFSVHIDDARPRHHLVYGYGGNPNAKGFLFPMQEYIINGDPYDPGNWSKAGQHLPAITAD